MRLTFPRVPRLPDWPRWAVAVTAGWLGLVWLAQRLVPHAVVCMFRRLTGMPCPSCGLTRGVMAVARGDLARGLAFNPLLLTALFLFLAATALRLVAGRAPRLGLTPRERRVAFAFALLLLAANWVYVLRTDREAPPEGRARVEERQKP